MAFLLYKWSFLLHFLLAGQTRPEPLPHPLYISVTEINYNATDKTLEVSCRLFTDDFENALGAIHHTKIDLTNPKDKDIANQQVYGYLKHNLRIVLDGKPVNLEFVGYEKERDATWSYLEATNITTAPSVIEIQNSILYDAFSEQMNLMHVTVNGKRKSTRLDNPEKNAKFQF
jgi:hypothetical protein